MHVTVEYDFDGCYECPYRSYNKGDYSCWHPTFDEPSIANGYPKIEGRTVEVSQYNEELKHPLWCPQYLIEEKAKQGE